VSKSSRFESDSLDSDDNSNRRNRRRVRQLLDQIEISRDIEDCSDYTQEHNRDIIVEGTAFDVDAPEEIYEDNSIIKDRKGAPKPRRDKGWDRTTHKRAFLDEQDN
jgi:hypothetical protein